MNVGPSEVALADLDIDDPSREAAVSRLLVDDVRATLNTYRHPRKNRTVRSNDLDPHPSILAHEGPDVPASTHAHAALRATARNRVA